MVVVCSGTHQTRKKFDKATSILFERRIAVGMKAIVSLLDRHERTQSQNCLGDAK